MLKKVTSNIGIMAEKYPTTKLFIKSIILAYSVTLVLFLISALALTYTNFQEKFISWVTVISTIVGIMFAGFVSVRNIKGRAWLKGSFAGILYIGIIYLIGILFIDSFSFKMHNFLLMILAGGLGGIGGIIGLNLGLNKR